MDEDTIQLPQLKSQILCALSYAALEIILQRRPVKPLPGNLLAGLCPRTKLN
jgi:hypothetical protein